MSWPGLLVTCLVMLTAPPPALTAPPSNPSCGGALSNKAFLLLEKHCNDCYNAFKLTEIYSECREDCYQTGTGQRYRNKAPNLDTRNDYNSQN